MAQKLHRQILDLVETTPITAPRQLDRHGLAKTVDELMAALELDKRDRPQVFGITLSLFATGKLASGGGVVVRVTSAVRTRQGQRNAGIRKQHARGRTRRVEFVPIDPIVPAPA